MTIGRTFADTLFRNGRIYTVDRRQPWVHCAAVKGGRFIALGEESDVAEAVGPETTVTARTDRCNPPTRRAKRRIAIRHTGLRY
jgi:predicted amidohydrolase YtcJ